MSILVTYNSDFTLGAYALRLSLLRPICFFGRKTHSPARIFDRQSNLGQRPLVRKPGSVQIKLTQIWC